MPAQKNLPDAVSGSARLKRGKTLENAKQNLPKAYGLGERLEMTSGDIVPVHDADMDLPGRAAAGSTVEVVDDCYVSGDGPNKGETLQQVKDLRTGGLFAVPTKRLRRKQGERHARLFAGASFGTPKSEIETRWEKTSDGRYRLRAS